MASLLKASVDLVIRNGNVASLQGEQGARAAEAAGDVSMREGWTIAVADGNIAWFGPDSEWDGDADREVDATGRLVTPGFVDPHTHLVYAGDRAFELAMKLAGKDYLEILAAGGGIAHTTGATRALDAAGLAAEARPRLLRMMAQGTTTLELKSGYALDTAGELAILEAGRMLESEGARMVHTFLGAHAVPKDFEGRTDAYVDLIVDEMLPAVAEQGIADFCDVFVEKDVFTYEQGARIFTAAKQFDLEPRLHADEIVNTKGAQLAAATGCKSADHLLRVSDEGIQAMAEAGTIATLLPTVPMTLMRPEWAPGKKFLQAGVPVALATDHNPNNPVTNMNLVGQLACFLLGMSPAQALTGATWNAACALALEDEVGSIEVGKRADVLVHDVADLDHWVYEPGRPTVDTVVCAGRIL